MNKILISQQDNGLSDLLSRLTKGTDNLKKALLSINKVSKQTNLLSINSSIEAARAGEVGRGFRIVAEEIKKLADTSAIATQESSKLIEEIHQTSLEVVAVRTEDVAYDTIDKVERNLFERNCDVQAWATFEEIRKCLQDNAPNRFEKATALMKNIIHIYEVYRDLYLTDCNGKIVAAGINQSLIGSDASSEKWFVEPMKSGNVYGSDLFYCNRSKGYSLAYSCPVKDWNGNIIGIFSTRFNWDYIYDILDSARIGRESNLYMVNRKGLIIASKDRSGILQRDLSSLEAVRRSFQGEEQGHTLEANQFGKILIFGFARSRGYNSYLGKDWTVVVEEEFVHRKG
ncbi:chemotaxis protein [Heliorestis acidaminivorans]|uniref:Chemotaxis protein n=1 Tax=Heliorestis acidaminivorans TaxID=553427 RepID=A0A6I0F331_9FIRM|nr:methyl-accepting chemotaxis protein [Heliorestis acidaminivorans]KAB2951534.1 chemotaxis protein [Heliorestis acidaminivorans]